MVARVRGLAARGDVPGDCSRTVRVGPRLLAGRRGNIRRGVRAGDLVLMVFGHHGGAGTLEGRGDVIGLDVGVAILLHAGEEVVHAQLLLGGQRIRVRTPAGQRLICIRNGAILCPASAQTSKACAQIRPEAVQTPPHVGTVGRQHTGQHKYSERSREHHHKQTQITDHTSIVG